MTLASVQQFSTTASINTDVDGISCATGWPPSNVGPAFRELMALLAASLQPLAMNIGGQSAVTLSAPQASAQAIQYSGALASPCTVTLPNAFFVGLVQNETTGGQALTLTAGIGTTVIIPADSNWYWVSTDGATNVAFLPLGIGGALGVVGALSVGGNASLNGALSVAGNETVAGSVAVTGNTRLGTTLQLGTLSFLNGGSGALVIESQISGVTPALIALNDSNTSNAVTASFVNNRTDGISCAFQFGAAFVGTITQNGASTSFNTTSDARLKIDDGLITTDWSGVVIDGLAPRFFRWKNHPEAESEPGFFAQEVVPVYPWAVFRGRGEPGERDFRPMQLDDGKLMVAVVAELQALRKRVAELEGRDV